MRDVQSKANELLAHKMVLYICMRAQTVIITSKLSPLSLCVFVHFQKTFTSKVYLFLFLPPQLKVCCVSHSQEELDQTLLAVQSHSLGAEGHVPGGMF